MDIFSRHDDATRQRLERFDQCFDMLEELAHSNFPSPVDQLEHSLQTATGAWRDHAPADLVLAALLHEVGRVIDDYEHGLASAELIRPLVGDAAYWIVRTHEIFNWRHTPPEYGLDRNGREVFRDKPWFATAEIFVDRWDSHAFAQDATALPPAFFYPMLRDRYTMGARTAI